MKKKFFNRILAIMLAAVVMMGCSAPAEETVKEETEENAAVEQEEEAKETKKIGFAHYYQRDSFNAELYKEIQREAENRGYEAFMYDGDADAQQQISQIENMVSQNLDMIFICPIDSKGIVSTIKYVNDSNIPVMTYILHPDVDAMAQAGASVVCEHGYNDEERGVMLAEYCAEHIKENLDGKAKLAILDVPDSEQLAVCTRVFKDTITKIDGIEVEFVNTDQNFKSEEALGMQIMENLLQANPDINVVYVAQEAGALGARTALQSMGSDAKVFCGSGGFTGQIPAILSAEDDNMIATMSVSARQVAKSYFDMIDMYFEDAESVPAEYKLPYSLITCENYMDFYNEAGYDFEELLKGE